MPISKIWTLLGALARETTRLRLGSLVTSIAFRHPAFLAAQAITVDQISHGRVDVAVGAGGPPNNYATLVLTLEAGRTPCPPARSK